MKTTWAVWQVIDAKRNIHAFQICEYSFNAAAKRLKGLLSIGIQAYAVDDNGCVLTVEA